MIFNLAGGKKNEKSKNVRHVVKCEIVNESSAPSGHSRGNNLIQCPGSISGGHYDSTGFPTNNRYNRGSVVPNNVPYGGNGLCADNSKQAGKGYEDGKRGFNRLPASPGASSNNAAIRGNSRLNHGSASGNEIAVVVQQRSGYISPLHNTHKHLFSLRNGINKVDMPLCHLELIPDWKVDNSRTDTLVRMLSNLYAPLMQRVSKNGYLPPPSAAWEINLSPAGNSFILTLPLDWAPSAAKYCNIVWPRATIKPIDIDVYESLNQPTAACQFQLKEHYLYRLKVDKRSNEPLDAILEVLSLLSDGESAHLQVLLTPAPPSWWEDTSYAYETMRSGHPPKRRKIDTATVTNAAFMGVASVLLETVNIIQEFCGNEPEKVDFAKPDKVYQLRESVSSVGCAAKIREDAFDVTIRLVVNGARPTKANAILKTLAFAMREIDGDNALIFSPTNPQKTLAQMKKRQYLPKLNHDYLGISEVSRLIGLPPGALQTEYRSLKRIEHRETKVSSAMTSSKGLLLGESTYRGDVTRCFIPITNFDELCRPYVVIAGMGQGKTKGFGGNMLVEAVNRGYVAICLDPGKGEMGDEAASVLPPDKIVRFKFGTEKYMLDWREANHGERSVNRIATEMMGFFDSAADAGEVGAQTKRYLRAAAKAVKSGSIKDINELFTDEDYYRSIRDSLDVNLQKIWDGYFGSSDARQMQLAGPVLNRLDIIMGDDYLCECLEEAKEGIDFVELIDSGPKAIIIDVPQELLGADVVDILGAFLVSKINLAQLTRKTRDEYPVFVVADELHQMLRSTATWKRVAVEARKYRFAWTWMFHSWEQPSKELAQIIRDAGPNYIIYPSSPGTFKALEAELSPFELEEFMKLPTHHAICAFRAANQRITPFMCKMAPPPSMRLKSDK